ncbi:MAG: hypothetical protein AAFO82_13895 [Bacteroidota bacterium]
MNWKLNAWTLLFAMSMIFVLWNACEQADTAVQKVKPTTENMAERILVNPINCQTTDSTEYVISDTVFTQDTMRYGEYLRGNFTPTNPDVIYFSMEPCELLDMARTLTWDQKVSAHLAINPSGSIVLHFRGEKYVSSGAEATAASGGMVNFDFSFPCPDSCDE